VFEELLNGGRVDSFHWFAVYRADRRLANPVDRKYGRLYRTVAMVKFESGEGLCSISTTLEASLVRSIAYAHAGKFHRDSFGTIREQVQIDGGVYVGRANQHGANESWCKWNQ